MKPFAKITLLLLVPFVNLRANDKQDSPENLIANGSFEDGPKEIYGDDGGDRLSEHNGYLPLAKGSTGVTGWVVTRGQIDLHANHVKAAKGRRSIDLNGSPGVGGIQQSITTMKGKKYVLKFMLAGHPGKVVADEPEKVLQVDIGDVTKTFKFDTTGHTKAKMGWVEKEVTFTAAGDKTTIELSSLSKLDRYCGPSIDDVRVYAAE